jgi:hypothetical protein
VQPFRIAEQRQRIESAIGDAVAVDDNQFGHANTSSR